MLKLPINLYLTTRMVADLDLNGKKTLTTIQEASDSVEIQELFFQKQFQKLSENFVEQKLKILINDNIPKRKEKSARNAINDENLQFEFRHKSLFEYFTARTIKYNFDLYKEDIFNLTSSQLSNFSINKRIIMPCEKNAFENTYPNVCAKISTFSADGKYLAIGQEDNTCKIWNIEKEFELIKTIQGHTNSINSVAFSVDGKYLAIWNVDKGFQLINTIQGYTDYIQNKQICNQKQLYMKFSIKDYYIHYLISAISIP
ncbi:hypothetical protein ABPG73_008344 [Tetrahymena malaccensis]